MGSGSTVVRALLVAAVAVATVSAVPVRNLSSIGDLLRWGFLKSPQSMILTDVPAAALSNGVKAQEIVGSELVDLTSMREKYPVSLLFVGSAGKYPGANFFDPYVNKFIEVIPTEGPGGKVELVSHRVENMAR